MKRIFIGSSSNESARSKAGHLRELLAGLGAEAICWFDTGVFPVSGITIDSLLAQTKECHGAIFIYDKDVKIHLNGKKQFAPRANVVYEAGLFAGALGKEAVAICCVQGVNTNTDLYGITHLKYNQSSPEEMQSKLSDWLKNVREDRPPKSINNVLMRSRKDNHRQYRIQDRLNPNGDGNKHIRQIRLMNIAGNIILETEGNTVRPQHRLESEDLPALIREILQNCNAELDLILTEPNETNLRDAENRVGNPLADPRNKVIYAAWKKIYQIVFGNDYPIYRNAADSGRFNYSALKTVIPYAVFGVEFLDEYSIYDHVKIDLYSCDIVNEDERRSFIVWKDFDPENYKFFIDNFDRVFKDTRICYKPSKNTIEEWINKAEDE